MKSKSNNKKKKNIKKKFKLFEKNKWGFTLVELLGVIVIIGLFISLSVVGIIGLVNKSKGNASIISEASIKETASIYSNEVNNDENYWIEMTRSGYEGKYFCVTIEELINKGFISKDKDLGDIDIHTYVGIRKDNITLVNGNPILLNDVTDKDEDIRKIVYGVCTGNIINESISDLPKISGGTSYTDEITNINFTDIKGENITIKESTCSYGTTSGNLDHEGVVTGNSCSINSLVHNAPYYVRVCTSTTGGSVGCSDTISINTKKVATPSINLSDRASITYDVSNIKGNSYYYFMSSINGKSDSNINTCTLNSDNSFSCNNDSTSNVSAGTWYKSSNKNISLTYSNGGNGSITARTYDKSNNYSEIKKNFIIYKVTFDKGNADTIDSIDGNIDRVCLAEVNGKCNIKSPSISKKGYDVVGWNTDKNSTSSTWNASTNKSNPSGTYYPITKAKTIKVTFYRNNSTSDSVTASQTFTYGVSGQKFSSKGWSKSGYNLAGWALNRSATSKDYDELSGVSDTWIFNNSPSISLYAVWTPKKINVIFHRNTSDSDSVTASQTFTYGVKNQTFSNKNWSKTGYTLSGWSATKSPLVKIYEPLSNVDDAWLAVTPSETHVYAVWSIITYNVKYDANNGSGAPLPQQKKWGTDLKLSSTKPTRSGYVFDGWNTKKDGTGTNYASGATYKTNANLTLYAKWKAATYTITYDANGGMNAPGSQTKKAGENIVLQSSRPRYSGYTFSGWNTSKLGYGTWYSPGQPYSADADLYLYAQWEEEEYFEISITYFPSSTPYNTATGFSVNHYCSSNYLSNASNCTLQAYSSDCALKSSQGAKQNCMNYTWVNFWDSSVYVNAFYYTSNSNVNSANRNTNDGQHCITFRGYINGYVTDNEVEKCYRIS